MANKNLHKELRELAEQEGEISPQAFRRLTLAAQADLLWSYSDLDKRIKALEQADKRWLIFATAFSGLLGGLAGSLF